MIRRFGQLLRLSLRNLVGYPLRTVLAAIGVAFGVASVVTMMAIAAGTEQALLREIGRLGIENVILNTVEPPQQAKAVQTRAWSFNRYGLTFKDERRIRATVPGLKRVLPVLKQLRTVWWGSRREQVTVHAVTAEHLRLFDLDVEQGRTLTAMDGERLARVCLVRSGLLRRLGAFEDPVGLPIRVDGHYYRIVGILPDQTLLGYAGKALGVDPKTTEIYVPYETVLQRVGTRRFEQKQGSTEMTDIELSQLVVSVEDVADVIPLSHVLQRLLDTAREQTDYEMVVPLEHLEQERKTKEIFALFLFVIACISLVVGAVGIVNIMLATVTERTREIGVRRAMGAKRRHVIGQFLAETTVLATAGGVLGVGVSFLFTWAMRAFFDFETLMTGASMVLALAISVGVGIASGLMPALRAAHLDPIAALRHE